jgi:hypothetical protein
MFSMDRMNSGVSTFPSRRISHVRVRMKWLFILASLAASYPASAEPDATTRQEISQLIDYLATSGCRFNRNGTWYDAPSAVGHIKRKYEYLLKKDLVPNAEAFIARAASESSSSGKPYLVKCGDAPEVQSAAWFREALAKARAR